MGAPHQDVRLDAQGQQLFHGVLGGFGFQLPGAGNLDNEGHMDEHHIPQGTLRAHLADGLQEGLGLDVPHGAADLADHHVHVLAGHGVDAFLDLACDVGNDLNRGPQVISSALPVQHGPVDLAGGDGAAAGEVLVHKPLVVAQVQIRLRAVLGDKDLPVLVRAHGAGVHIDIRIEFLVPHPEAPLLQKPSQGRRADALAQARYHAAGDKYKFCFHDIHLALIHCGLGRFYGIDAGVPKGERLCRTRSAHNKKPPRDRRRG